MEKIYNDIKYKFSSGNTQLALFTFIIIAGALFTISLKLLCNFMNLSSIFRRFIELFSLSNDWASWCQKPWSIVTYLFINHSILSIIWSLFVINFFSKLFYYFTGRINLFYIYLFCAIFVAAFVSIVSSVVPMFRGLKLAYSGLDGINYALIFACATIDPFYKVSLILIGRISIRYLSWGILFFAIYGIGYDDYSGVVKVGGAISGHLFVRLILKHMTICDTFFSKISAIFLKRRKLKIIKTNRYK